jgi:hypothetical protein
MAKKSSGEECVNHYGLVRLRISGAGNFRMRLQSLGEVREYVMVPLVMVDPTDIEPVRLSNFTQQRASLEGKTTAIDEVFEISKIIVFAKQVATSLPGN